MIIKNKQKNINEDESSNWKLYVGIGLSLSFLLIGSYYILNRPMNIESNISTNLIEAQEPDLSKSTKFKLLDIKKDEYKLSMNSINNENPFALRLTCIDPEDKITNYEIKSIDLYFFSKDNHLKDYIIVDSLSKKYNSKNTVYRVELQLNIVLYEKREEIIQYFSEREEIMFKLEVISINSKIEHHIVYAKIYK